MEMGCDRPGSDAQDLRGLLRAEVEEHSQAHNLALSFGKAEYGADEDRIDWLVGRVRALGDDTCSRARTASPRRSRHVDRGSRHPGDRFRVPLHSTPARKGPGEGLADRVVRELPIAGADVDGPEHSIAVLPIELGEVTHAPSFRSCLPCNS